MRLKLMIPYHSKVIWLLHEVCMQIIILFVQLILYFLHEIRIYRAYNLTSTCACIGIFRAALTDIWKHSMSNLKWLCEKTYSMEIIKITGFFCPFRRLHPNSVLIVNKPAKQHLFVVLWKWSRKPEWMGLYNTHPC